jgi:hypothetical protein
VATAVASWKSNAGRGFASRCAPTNKRFQRQARRLQQCERSRFPPGLVGQRKGGRCTIEAKKEGKKANTQPPKSSTATFTVSKFIICVLRRGPSRLPFRASG